jgi:hypothetical protein
LAVTFRTETNGILINMIKYKIVNQFGFFLILMPLLLKSFKSAGQTAILAANPNIQYIGRFDMTDTTAPALWLTGLEIRAKFKGTSISAIFSGAPTYFNLIIDDRLSYFCFAGTGDVICPLAVGLKDTIHTISIIKRQAPWSSQQFKGFVLDSGKSLTTPPPRRNRKIEFYGDSMTQGAQVDVPGTGPDLNDLFYDNNYNSYATMTARAFDAEYSIVAKNGATLVAGNNRTDIPSFYDKVFFSAKSPPWDFSKWKADVVVINLGENDDPVPANFVSTYIGFVKNIRTKYPDAHIFLLAGPLWNGIDKAHCDAIQQVVTVFNSNNDKKVYFYKFKNDVKHPGHNRTADNIILSNELVEKIRSVIW